MSEYENMSCAADQIARAIHEAIRENVPSLRDHFAAHALTGYIATYAGPDCGMPSYDRAAKIAYELAEAMLEERSKRMGAT